MPRYLYILASASAAVMFLAISIAIYLHIVKWFALAIVLLLLAGFAAVLIEEDKGKRLACAKYVILAPLSWIYALVTRNITTDRPEMR